MPYADPEKRRAYAKAYYATPEQREKARKAERARYAKGYYARNRERILANNKRSRDAHPDRERQRHLKRHFGLTPAEYAALLQEQGGGCAICGTEATNRALPVDHNHTTGENRGILCDHCNRGLGEFRDSVDVLMKAIAYLEAY
jgi:hypothetical protein